MRIAFLNPQGIFDPEDSYWTEGPDFGNQLVYVKQVTPDPNYNPSIWPDKDETWKEALCFAHKIAALKLQNIDHIEQLNAKELLYN
jgi:hypothetical protein